MNHTFVYHLLNRFLNSPGRQLTANRPANAGIIVCAPVRKAILYVQKISEEFLIGWTGLKMPAQERLRACERAIPGQEPGIIAGRGNPAPVVDQE